MAKEDGLYLGAQLKLPMQKSPGSICGRISMAGPNKPPPQILRSCSPDKPDVLKIPKLLWDLQMVESMDAKAVCKEGPLYIPQFLSIFGNSLTSLSPGGDKERISLGWGVHFLFILGKFHSFSKLQWKVGANLWISPSTKREKCWLWGCHWKALLLVTNEAVRAKCVWLLGCFMETFVSPEMHIFHLLFPFLLSCLNKTESTEHFNCRETEMPFYLSGGSCTKLRKGEARPPSLLLFKL